MAEAIFTLGDFRKAVSDLPDDMPMGVVLLTREELRTLLRRKAECDASKGESPEFRSVTYPIVCVVPANGDKALALLTHFEDK